MKYLYIFIVVIFIFSLGCTDHAHEKTSEDNHDHAAEHTLKISIIKDSLEIYAEMPEPVPGDSVRILAHLTNLTNYRPIKEGTLTITLSDKVNKYSATSTVSDVDGIFIPILKVEKAGEYQLSFEYNLNNKKIQLLADSLHVEDADIFEGEHNHAHAEESPQGVSFTKEQAWKSDFGILVVKRVNFNEVIKTSGQILPANGDEMSVVATSPGVVMFTGNKVLPGKNINKGENLFTISGSGLLEGNVSLKFAELQSKYEKTKTDFERAEKFIKDKIITEKEFIDARTNYDQAKAEYENFTRNYTSGGKSIVSPLAGFVKNVLVTEGQFVETGTPLATISQNRNLIIRADVSQNHWDCLPNIVDAHFRTSYDSRVFSIDSLNGKLISYGKSAENSAFYAPVFFQIDNKGNLIPGAFIEVYLISKIFENTLVVPVTALIEEQGNFYVFVQTSGELYEKREIKTGLNNGYEIQIISGIKENEVIVSKGAWLIKLASASNAMPAHDHNH